MTLLPEGPSPQQVMRDLGDNMDPRDAIAVLTTMRKRYVELRGAIRWRGVSARLSEAEMNAAEHMYDRQIAALTVALDMLSIFE